VAVVVGSIPTIKTVEPIQIYSEGKKIDVVDSIILKLHTFAIDPQVNARALNEIRELEFR
jgi:hypothetical protein